MFSTIRAFGVFVINGKGDQIIILDKEYFIMVWRGMIKMQNINSIFKIRKAVLEGVTGNGRRVFAYPITSRAAFFVLGMSRRKNNGLV